MENTKRLTAFVAYLIPVVGWLYVWLFQQKNEFARFHVRQAVGLVLYLLAAVVGWVGGTWIITWIPYGFILGMALFSVLMAAFVIGFVSWVMGLINALSGRVAYLPLIGQRASQLPF